MSLKINYNVSAMIANNSLKLNDVKLTTSLERLSSGYKINSARDDAAGLAISRRMNAQIKGLKAASQDTKDGISVIEIADGALSEVHDILQRMNELAVKSANGTLSDGDRESIQMEVAQLGEEIDRIGQTTEYNSQKLFTGDFDLKGYTNRLAVKVDKYADSMTSGIYSFDIGQFKFEEDENGDINLYEYNGNTESKVEVLRPDGKKETYSVSGDIYHLRFKGDNGDDFTLDISGYGYRDLIETAEDGMEKYDEDINNLLSLSTVTDDIKYTTDGKKISEVKVESGNVSGYSGTEPAITYSRSVEKTTTINYDEDENPKTTSIKSKITTTYCDTDTNKKVTLTEEIESYEDHENGTSYTRTVSSKKNVEIPDTFKQPIEVDLTGYGAMTFQIGANESQTLDIRFEKLSMESLGFKYQDTDQIGEMCLDLTTDKGALHGINQIGAAIEQVSLMRSRLGAYQNRLEHTEANLATSEENMTAGYSRVMDTDMAEEMSTYSNLQIVSQAATAILTQANERPSQMLQLLQ